MRTRRETEKKTRRIIHFGVENRCKLENRSNVLIGEKKLVNDEIVEKNTP